MTDTAISVASTTYPISVNYGLTLAAMVAAGKYDWVNNQIDADNFPVQGSGIVNMDGVLYHPNRLISSEDAISEMGQREQPIRPATMAELLAFGVKHPAIQRQFPVVALGQKSKRPWLGYLRVGCLCRLDAERDLRLLGFEGDWRGCYRFLGFRKPAD